jgi:hypothetical protein
MPAGIAQHSVCLMHWAGDLTDLKNEGFSPQGASFALASWSNAAQWWTNEADMRIDELKVPFASQGVALRQATKCRSANLIPNKIWLKCPFLTNLFSVLFFLVGSGEWINCSALNTIYLFRIPH